MITIVCGTNRESSVSRIISELYQQNLEGFGVDSDILLLEDLPADFLYTALYDKVGQNSAFNAFQERFDASDKVVFVLPEYNGSFPGVVKAFIDGLKYPGSFSNKKAALVGLSSGVQGAVFAMSHMTDILNYLGVQVLALKPKLAQIEMNMREGELTNDLYLDLLKSQAEQLVAF